MKKSLSWLLTLMLVVSLCSFTPAALAESTTLTLSADALTVALGKTVTLKASAKPYVAAKAGVRFAVSDEAIATVTSRGAVTGVAAGQCQLTVTSVYDETVSLTIPVTVVIPVKKLTLTAPEDTLPVGGTLQLSVAYLPADASLQAATFESSSDSIATVSSTGLVTGIKRGSATITARSTDGAAKASVRLIVAQLPETVEISPETVAAAPGRKVQLKATVLPSNANSKSVQWTSADETIATVSAKGQVTVVGVGATTITATASENPAATATVPVQGLELAQSIAFDNPSYSVLINETTQLHVDVEPATATAPSITYKVKNGRIASVDENGVVTGLKGGTTTVYAYTGDGSKKRASATLEVIVPVTGVSYKYKDVRVGTGSYATFSAEISPSSATNKAMTWVSSDESIATVKGTTNRFRVSGRRWGRVKITGTTEDGGYTVSLYADIGSLRHAVTIVSVDIRDGKPYIRLKNRSDMNISQVRFEMLGYDQSLRPIVMSTKGDTYVLEGSYNLPLSEGETTQHGQFTFYNKSNYAGLAILQLAITGWSTDTGYYDRNGQLQYNYNINQEQWEWVTYPASSDVPAVPR